MCAPTGDDGPSEERIYGAPARAQRSGSRGESRSSEMRELSPPGGSEGYEACDDEGAASWTHRKPSPHRGEGGPKGRMRGRMRGASPPWAPSSASLRSAPSPKGEGFLRRARRLGAPTSAPAEVVRRHEITHHVGRGLAPSAQSLPPSFASQMPPPSSEGGFLRGCSLWPPLTRTDSPCQGADSPYQGEMSRSDRGDREMAKGGRDAVERSETGGKIAPFSS